MGYQNKRICCAVKLKVFISKLSMQNYQWCIPLAGRWNALISPFICCPNPVPISPHIPVTNIGESPGSAINISNYFFSCEVLVLILKFFFFDTALRATEEPLSLFFYYLKLFMLVLELYWEVSSCYFWCGNLGVDDLGGFLLGLSG